MPRTPGQLERISTAVTRWSGTSLAFIVATGMIAVWLVAGPFYGFTDSWQLVMNTVTSIVTFLMVFLIQRAQNKESSAIQIKLNELIASLDGASNRLINVEDRSEQEVLRLHALYRRMLRQALTHPETTRPCSIEETVRTRGKNSGRVEPRTPEEIRRAIRQHLRLITRHEVEIDALRSALRAEHVTGPEVSPAGRPDGEH